MDKSYRFRRDVLLAHIDQWKTQQKRDRYSDSERELARQIGITHTTLQNYRKGRDSKGAPVSRMNYRTAVAISMTLRIPLEFLLPELLDARSDTSAIAATK